MENHRVERFLRYADRYIEVSLFSDCFYFFLFFLSLLFSSSTFSSNGNDFVEERYVARNEKGSIGQNIVSSVVKSTAFHPVSVEKQHGPFVRVETGRCREANNPRFLDSARIVAR